MIISSIASTIRNIIEYLNKFHYQILSTSLIWAYDCLLIDR